MCIKQAPPVTHHLVLTHIFAAAEEASVEEEAAEAPPEEEAVAEEAPAPQVRQKKLENAAQVWWSLPEIS